MIKKLYFFIVPAILIISSLSCLVFAGGSEIGEQTDSIGSDGSLSRFGAAAPPLVVSSGDDVDDAEFPENDLLYLFIQGLDVLFTEGIDINVSDIVQLFIDKHAFTENILEENSIFSLVSIYMTEEGYESEAVRSETKKLRKQFEQALFNIDANYMHKRSLSSDEVLPIIDIHKLIFNQFADDMGLHSFRFSVNTNNYKDLLAQAYENNRIPDDEFFLHDIEDDELINDVNRQTERWADHVQQADHRNNDHSAETSLQTQQETGTIPLGNNPREPVRSHHGCKAEEERKIIQSLRNVCQRLPSLTGALQVSLDMNPIPPKIIYRIYQQFHTSENQWSYDQLARAYVWEKQRLKDYVQSALNQNERLDRSPDSFFCRFCEDPDSVVEEINQRLVEKGEGLIPRFLDTMVLR
ncbi:hypothetical protein CI610_00027 [invertebrate metagenome]|uniref:Uncharacterized protein n=1 Tax=invertebrate metagenome TaxID=1711999 RepID=A0A2H9TCP4_9ZZZZ